MWLRSCNRLQRVGPSLWQLGASLVVLNLERNQLTELPPDIGKLAHLRSVRDGRHRAPLPRIRTADPPFLCPPPSLIRQLYLAGNFLRTVPKQLDQLRQLEELDLSSNLLERLPAGCLGGLVAVRELSLQDNRLSELPTDVASLRELRILNVRQNVITVLPPGLPLTPHLRPFALHPSH